MCPMPTRSAPSNIAYFAFDVPAGADFDTNRLRNCLSNGLAGVPAPLNLLFDQTALPTGDLLGDYTLLAGVSGGAYVLATTRRRPTSRPGRAIFWGCKTATPTR